MTIMEEEESTRCIYSGGCVGVDGIVERKRTKKKKTCRDRPDIRESKKVE